MEAASPDTLRRLGFFIGAGTLEGRFHETAEGVAERLYRDGLRHVYREEVAGHDDDRLRRVPKELDDADHPFPDDLKLRSFSAGTKLTQKSVTSTSLPDDLAKTFKLAAPYTRFICEAIGVPF